MSNAAAALESAAPEGVSPEPVFLVYDTDATNGSRVHELVNKENPKEMRRFTFVNYQEPVEIPVKFAMCLVPNPAFKVMTPDGKRIQQRKKADDSTGQGINLEADECIAKYDELTKDALQARVIAIGGKASGTKPQLIATLMANESEEAQTKPKGDAGGDESIDNLDELLDDDLAFGD